MIRSELDVLLEKVEDSALRADLRSQIDRLKQRRSFGLVFEQHIPERVRLPQHPIRVGSHVVSRDDDDSPTFEVVAIEDGLATLELVRDADGAYVPRGEHPVGERERVALDSLVVITDFGEPVLPGLRYLGAVERGGDKPYHVVINGENHHALEALRFTHAGKVDCIYIDPPYNSGARDWKYNNDYVDDTDAYRHSKWLAFMERRLKLAKELLNPDDSVLIVTIDEKEYLRLGLLLEQTFPEARPQMVSSVVNPKGATRSAAFGRTDEYIYFLMFGSAAPQPLVLGTEWKVARDARSERLRWAELLRAGTNARREDRPKLFYPIFLRNTEDGPAFQLVGATGPGIRREDVIPPEGCVAVWPIRSDGSEGNWQISTSALVDLIKKGYVKTGVWRAERTTVSYLKRGEQEKVERGLFPILGRRSDGSILVDSSEYMPVFIPGTQWRIASHEAGGPGGTNLFRFLLPGRRFPFPKSLYAVEDVVRFFVADKPHAVVLDFFAGSGTTAHAAMRLNKQDGGRRQSIMVTNNEVSADEVKELRANGLRPSDADWEALGIFEHVTRPRVIAAITGRKPDGDPIKGEYKFTDEFAMADGFEENAAFLELRYLDADDVDLGLAYENIAPLLWLRAGGEGPIAPRVDDAGNPLSYAWTERYGVLFDEDRWRGFVSSCPETARAAFIVTNSPTTFAGIAAELPTNIDTVRLYDTYLSMFLPERGRA
jgi:adenine-specific DNA-methyltransferase